jgi:hypothetical protein
VPSDIVKGLVKEHCLAIEPGKSPSLTPPLHQKKEGIVIDSSMGLLEPLVSIAKALRGVVRSMGLCKCT